MSIDPSDSLDSAGIGEERYGADLSQTGGRWSDGDDSPGPDDRCDAGEPPRNNVLMGPCRLTVMRIQRLRPEEL